MSSQRILVIGAGFLGRAIALRLAAEGSAVTLLSPDIDASGWPAGIAAVRGRQEDAALLGGLLEGHECVIHAAWGTTPSSSAGRPALEAERGLDPFLAFLETLQRFPHARLLFLSSGGTVYGDPARLPVTESAPLQPLSCHGAGKAAAELFLRMRPPERTLVLRPSNIYGPGQSLRSGFGVVRHLLYCATEGMPFQLWGDGTQTRDYLYVDDFTEAVSRLAAQRDLAGVFNVGSGCSTPLEALIELAGQAAGRRIRVERLPARDGDVRHIVLDICRLRQATGWQPGVSLEKGLAATWHLAGG